MQNVGVLALNDVDTSILSFDNVRDFINIIKQYPVGTEETNIQLLKQYHAGDLTARDLLIKTNLRLVLNVAKKECKNTKSFEFLDCVNDGIAGLIKAIDYYDLDRGTAKFSSYASTSISRVIKRMLGNNDKDIRRPIHLVQAVKKYNAIIEYREKMGEDLPTDDEWCTLLGVTQEILSYIKNDHLLNTSSLNVKMDGEDDNSGEIGDTIPDTSDYSSNFESDLDDKSLLAYLKNNFVLTRNNPMKYYILYNRVFNQAKISLEKLAEPFGITRERIRQIEMKLLKRIENLYQDGELNYRFVNLHDLSVLNLEPVDPEDIFKYLFFRNILNEEEKKVYKTIIEGKYKAFKYAQLLGMTLGEYNAVVEQIRKKTELTYDRIKNIYACFRANVINKYGSSIYNADLDAEFGEDIINEKLLSIVWSGVSYETVINSIGESGLSHYAIDLLRKYFNSNQLQGFSDKSSAETEVNSLIFGLRRGKELSLKKLYNVLIENRDKFGDEMVMFLEMAKFGLVSKKEFEDRYPNSSLSVNYLYDYVEKLEKIYFNFSYYKEDYFIRDHYLAVRDAAVRQIPSDRIRLLDLFYGVNCKSHTYEEIARILLLEDEKMNFTLLSEAEQAEAITAKIKDIIQIFRHAKEKMMSIYIDRSNGLVIDESLYIPYVLDDNMDFSDTVRDILKCFLIEHKSKDEIAKIYGKNTKYINETISKSIDRIDGYRYGIFRVEDKYTTEDLNDALERISCNEEEKSIISEVLETSWVSVSNKYGKNKVDRIMKKFYDFCSKLKTSKVDVTFKDIEEAVQAHISERVLNDKGRFVLSYFYGIRCDINPTGIKLSRKEFSSAYPKISRKFQQYHDEAISAIAALKSGMTRAKYAYMKRDQLNKSLKDPRIPISNEDRELLYYLFELNGYPYKDMNELAEFKGDKARNLIRRVQNAFITIYKYENMEISQSVSFEYDILPNLKYFSRSDQAFLIDKYQNKLTHEELAKKYGITLDQVHDLFVKLSFSLKNLIEGFITGFDFDYYYEHFDDEEVPYYGNRTILKEVFNLYFEKRLSFNEIVDALGLEINPKTLNRALQTYMLAFLKRREGITKQELYSYEEIRDYYLAHSDEMSVDKKGVYRKYFNRVDKGVVPLKARTALINPMIITDLMKANNRPVFSIEIANKDDVKRILSKYKNVLSDKSINTLLGAFNISHRELLSGSEQMKVLRILKRADLCDLEKVS